MIPSRLRLADQVGESNLRRNSGRFITALLLAMGWVMNCPGAEIVWTNTAGGNWGTAANWNPNLVPGSADNAYITNNGTYTVTVNVSATVASLQAGGSSGTQTLSLSSGTLTLNGASLLGSNGTFAFSAGTLTGSGDVTVTGTLNWTGGTMSGSGRTTIVNPGALNLSGGTKQLNRVLQNDGTATWTAGDLAMNGGTFTNSSSFTVSSASTLSSYGTGGVNAFHNGGTFTKLGAGLTQFIVSSTAVPFNNTGTVDVQAGTLNLNAGGTNSSSLSVGAAGSLTLGASYTHLAGSLLSGAGTVTISGGTHAFPADTFTPTGIVNFTAGTITINNTITPSALGTLAANVTFTTAQNFGGFTLTGTLTGSGDVTVTGTLNWTGGTMSGSGRTTIASGATLTINASTHQLERVLQNDGVATWTAGALQMNGGTFTNRGSFTASGAATLQCYGTGGVNVFHNGGTFTKQGAGTASFTVSSTAVTFNNSGAVDVQGGTLTIGAGGSNSNALSVGAAGTLTLNATYTHAVGSSLSGTGTVTITGGIHTFPAGTFTPTGTVNFSGGTITINNTITPSALGTMGAIVTFTTAQSFSGFTLTGTLTGSGDVTVTGTLNWSGGTMSGSGRTIIASGATLTINTATLDRVLQNDGVATWTSGALQMNGGTITNSGSFTANSATTLNSYGTGGVNAFHNGGTFTKQGAGSVSFTVSTTGVPFNNTGTVDVQAGTLTLNAGGTNNAAILIGAGTSLGLSASYNHEASSTISGQGTLNITGGSHTFVVGAQVNAGLLNFSGSTISFAASHSFTNVNFSSGTITGGGDVTITGTLNWTGGTMSGSGRTTIVNTGALNLSGGTKQLNRVLQNDGTATWTAGDLAMNGGTFTNSSSFTVSSASTLSSYGTGGVNAFHNGGTFTKLGAGLTQFIVSSAAVPFNNTGTVDVQAGTLTLNAGGTNNAAILIGAGTSLGLSASYNHEASSTISGQGTLNITGGSHTFVVGAQVNAGLLNFSGSTISFAASHSFTNVNFSSGTITGGGDVTITGTLNWTGGTMSGSGRTTIVNTGTLNLSGGTKQLNRVLQNDGAATWTAGDLAMNGGTFTNSSSFTVSSASTLSSYGTGGVNAFHNGGTFTKLGAGLTQFIVSSAAVPFNNTGTVDVQAGTLTLNAGGTNNAAILIGAGTSLGLSASYNHEASSTISGQGTLNITGGSHTFVVGAQVNAGLLNFSGSTISFAASHSFTNVNFSSGTITGGGDVTITGTLNWTGGTMSGSGRTTIVNTGTLNLSGGTKQLNRVLQNDGAATWTAGDLAMNGGTFTNSSSFTVSSAATLQSYGTGGVNAFHNGGMFTKLGAGLTQFIVSSAAVPFNNTGTVDVQAGTLSVIGASFVQTAGLTLLRGGNLTVGLPFQLQGGTLAGTNTVTGSVTNNGIVSPGASPGRLTITGAYTQTSNGALNVELAGTSPGTTFDALAVGGAAALAGTLNVTLTNGFYPATNASFTFLTNVSRSGTFSSFNYPSNDVGMQLAYTATNATIQVINVRPALPVFGSQTTDELVLFNLNAAGTDDDQPAQTLTYALTNSPPGASIDTGTGLISWIPAEDQGPGATNFTVLMTDNGTPNLTVSRTFQITINEINVPPVLTPPPNQAFNEETLFSATATATDSDIPTNEPLVFELVSGPPGLTVSTNGAIAWTPTEAQGSNVFTVSVRVTDLNTNAVNEQQLSTTNSFILTVNEVNRPPSLSVPADQVLTEETQLSVSASANDPDLPPNGLSYSLLSPPTGMTIDTNNGAIQWLPTEVQGSNSYTITVVATDDNPNAVNATQLSITNSFTVTVNESNRPPVLTVPTDQVLDELTPLAVNASATDPDLPANSLAYSLALAPAGMVIDTNTGAIIWTPTEAQGPSSNFVVVVVTDLNTNAVNAQQLSATNNFSVMVNEVNVAPLLEVPGNQVLDELTILNVSASATDADDPANPLAYSLALSPTGMVIDTNTGAITWTPTEAQGPGSNFVLVVVTDLNTNAVNAPQLSTSAGFSVVVNEVNVAPLLEVPGNQVLDELTTLNVSASATDTDDPVNPLAYSLALSPAGMVIDTNTGAITWTPTEAQGPGSNFVMVVVTDLNTNAVNAPQLSTSAGFSVVVNEVNVAPLLEVPGNQVLDELTILNVSASATDADDPANPLAYSLALSPAGMTIDTNTGAIIWTPTETQGPGSNFVMVVVTDLNTNAVNAPQLSTSAGFSVVVNEVNTPPAVDPFADRTVNPGQTISFTATATDADLPTNGLSFSLVSPPSGATISSGGAFQWRPSVAQADTTNLVLVVATDDGVPPLSGTNSFTVVVNSLSPVLVTPLSYSGGAFTFEVSGTTGPDYFILASTNLTDWLDIGTNLSPATPFQFTDAAAGTFTNRYYRVRLGP